MRRREIGTNPTTGEPIFAPPQVAPEFMDLTKLSREHKRISTSILIWTDYERSEWIRLGQIELREHEGSNSRGIWRLTSYLSNATDFEHDSARVLGMELVGVTFDSVDYGRTRLGGWIKADGVEDFRVPTVGYNPLKHPETTECKIKSCRADGAHLIVPEGFYYPPVNAALFEQVRGRRIEIITGVKNKED